jgi:DNA (cytosine-5)-methyltransferase 1
MILWPIEPNVGRVANGIPRRVDRIKALGNAIVPQVAYEIFYHINLIENGILKNPTN